MCNQCPSSLTLWVRKSGHGKVYLIQHYVIKFVSDLLQVCDFLQALVSSTNKTDCHNITGILLKEALSSITLSLTLEWLKTGLIAVEVYFNCHLNCGKLIWFRHDWYAYTLFVKIWNKLYQQQMKKKDKLYYICEYI
jgi:hypothetical protein